MKTGWEVCVGRENISGQIPGTIGHSQTTSRDRVIETLKDDLSSRPDARTTEIDLSRDERTTEYFVGDGNPRRLDAQHECRQKHFARLL